MPTTLYVCAQIDTKVYVIAYTCQRNNHAINVMDDIHINANEMVTQNNERHDSLYHGIG